MEPLEPVTGHFEHSPGRPGTNEVDFRQEFRTGEGLCSAQRMEEEEGRGTQATGRLDDEGDHGSWEERGWNGDPGVVLALGTFVLGGCSVSREVGECRSLLVLRSRGVYYCDVNVESVRTLEVLDVGADIACCLRGSDDLANFELHAQVGLLDTGIESLDKLVELITDRVVADVPDPFVEATAESMERVLGGIEGLAASTYSDLPGDFVGGTKSELSSSNATELVG